MAARAGWAPRALARAYLAGGARCLQIRTKSWPSGKFLELCAEVVNDARQVNATVIVNDRADLAWLAGAAGVHIGQDDLPPDRVRRVVGPDAVVGLSTHTADQLERGRLEPVSYLAVGPVFGSATKATGYAPVGLDLVRYAASFGLPVVAIGGLTLANAGSVLDAGATSVAVISDLLADGDPKARVRAYVEETRRFSV